MTYFKVFTKKVRKKEKERCLLETGKGERERGRRGGKEKFVQLLFSELCGGGGLAKIEEGKEGRFPILLHQKNKRGRKLRLREIQTGRGKEGEERQLPRSSTMRMGKKGKKACFGRHISRSREERKAPLLDPLLPLLKKKEKEPEIDQRKKW